MMKFTQEEVASKLGITHQAVSKIEAQAMNKLIRGLVSQSYNIFDVVIDLSKTYNLDILSLFRMLDERNKSELINEARLLGRKLH